MLKNRKTRMWIGFWDGYVHVAFFRDIFGHIAGEDEISIKKEEDLGKLPLCVGRDIIKNVLKIIPEDASICVGADAKRSFSITWPGLHDIHWPKTESLILGCIRKVLHYGKLAELATSKRLELLIAFPGGKTIVNVEFHIGVFYLRFIGRDVFHKALPRGRETALKVEDLTLVTDDEKVLLKKFIRIAGSDGDGVHVSDSRNAWIDIGKIGKESMTRKKGLIIKALKSVFGDKVKNLPFPQKGSHSLVARMSFSF